MSRSQWYIFKKGKKKQKFSHILKRNFIMFPKYIYKSFDIFTKIIIVTIENYIKPVEEIGV